MHVPKSSILEVKPYVPGKATVDTAVRIVKLSSNENPMGPSPRAKEAYAQVAGTLHRYPDVNATALRQAIAGVYGLREEQIVCGAGSDELIGLLVQAFTAPADEVLYSEYGFLMYRIYALTHGAVPVVAPEAHLRTDIEALLAAVTPRTRLVFIANPNNPTGSCLSREEIAALRAKLPAEVLLVIDAAYAEYVQDDGYTPGADLVDKGENVVMLRTFSKVYGLPALRLGWAYASQEVVDILQRVRGPFNVSMPAQYAGAAAVQDTEYTRQAVHNNALWRQELMQALQRLGLEVLPSEGNFLLVRFVSAQMAAQVNTQLMQRGILVRDVIPYNLPEYLRISVGLPEENQALVEALQTIL